MIYRHYVVRYVFLVWWAKAKQLYGLIMEYLYEHENVEVMDL
jgi:hypothetical protein